ncbi:M56 family metallopeptidase [Nocardiopsis tropica]|uniref:M56 family metallopeptidase n=1 Tax=Nocardiopsis tropica TaxID=109330 RepID=A0ABU7KZS6_9ACTN|nr:M56 family metallopeptidase [Nocardiopsis umidischolae]MEE2054147.1 M56 family metallopeptidase [Nocardiopsis umidischolae]
MIWSFAALCAVAALGVRGPGLLRRTARSCDPGPRTMLALWTAATAAWVLSCATLLAVLAADLLGPSVKGVLAACVSLLQALERNHAGWGIAAGAALALAALLRLLWTAARQGRAGLSWRRTHHDGLLATAQRRRLHGQPVWLLETAEPGAYCVPGSRGGVVITRGALGALTASQARAVLAHERAHLRGRHHLVVAWARLLDRAFPGVPLFRAAAREVPVLVEWAADDHAVRTVGMRPLVHALGSLAGAAPAGAPQTLSIGGACPVERVRRQVRPPERCRPWRAWARTWTTAALVALPLVFTVASALAAVLIPHCQCAAG